MKPTRTYIYYCFILITIIIYGCDFSDNKLQVWNNSKDSIAFLIPTEPDYFPTSSADNGLSKSENDSLLKTRAKYDPTNESFGGVHFLAGNSNKHLLTFNTTWEAVIGRTHKRKLKIYFFPAHVMTSGSYTWKEIWDKNMYTQENEFAEDDLKKVDWKIYYTN